MRIFTCIQGRHDTTRKFFEHIQWLREETGEKLPVTFGYTLPEDLDNVKRYLTSDCQPVRAENEPISFKHNIAMNALLNETSEGRVMHLGSDNMVTLDYLKTCLNYDAEFFGISSIDIVTEDFKKAKRFQYDSDIRKGRRRRGLRKIIGAGRVWKRDVLEKTKGGYYLFQQGIDRIPANTRTFLPDAVADFYNALTGGKVQPLNSKYGKQCALWPAPVSKGLDSVSTDLLRKLGVKVTSIEDLWDTPQVLDIKNGENITPYDRLKGKQIPVSEIQMKYFPYVSATA